MLSVSNINWALFDVLLRPCDLDAWYYRPFGTMDNFVAYEFRPTCRMHQEHVLFHYEQEPIIDATLGQAYYNVLPAHKKLRILANSEHSQAKKNLVAEHQMADWYFFYHGLAVLDWFRDALYITSDIRPDVVFLSIANLTEHNKSYRIQFIAQLWHLGIIDKGRVSLATTSKQCYNQLQRANNHLSLQGRDLIKNWLENNPQLPIIADCTHPDGTMSAQFGLKDLRLWQSAFIHVVNESVFFYEKLHLTEKIFKPIVANRPFVLLAAPGNLEYLRGYGFKTFDQWIDESYDHEPNHDKRLAMVAEEIQRLCSMSPAALQDMLEEMRPVLDYNKQHLFLGNFKKQIVTELVDNFGKCLRVWNNGRLDHRCPEHPDLDLAKQLLMR
jgi:hypothetical protein